MITPQTAKLEVPEANFGIDSTPYLARRNKAEKKTYLLYTLTVVVPVIIIAAVLSAMYGVGLFVIAIGLLVMLTILPIMSVEHAGIMLSREFDKEFIARRNEWVTSKLAPFLQSEHGITLVGDNYDDMFHSNGAGIKGKTRNGEIIRFTIDGVSDKTKLSGFHREITFDVEDLRVMVVQKEYKDNS